MKKFTILTAILIILSCSSDDGPVDQESLLPPITSTGENTFGCLIDGKFFRPRDGRITLNSNNKGLRIVQTETNNFELHVYDRKSENPSSLFIHLENLYITDEGSYDLDSANGLRGIDGPNHNYIYGVLWNKFLGEYQRYQSYENSGIVIINNREFVQDLKNIYSGNFYVKLVNSELPTDTVEITLGRFDLEAYSHQFKNWD
jgi:hypothetical protein